MSEFKNYHPIVNFIYFLFAIVFNCLFLHPVALLISLIAGFTYLVILKGNKNTGKHILGIIIAMVLMSLVNPMFNHQGETIVAYFPSGNPLTIESIFYGWVSALMIMGVILHFSCFNEVMTSDKFVYLFGKIVPSLSLVFSMVLRFVPKLIRQIKLVTESRKCLGEDTSGGIVKRGKAMMGVLSIIVTWSLENALDTADSMKARGYGIRGRTSFSLYKFSKRDISTLVGIFLFASYVAVGGALGKLKFQCFPSVQFAENSFYSLTVIAAYLIYVLIPVFIELWEGIRWKSIKSKI